MEFNGLALGALQASAEKKKKGLALALSCVCAHVSGRQRSGPSRPVPRCAWVYTHAAWHGDMDNWCGSGSWVSAGPMDRAYDAVELRHCLHTGIHVPGWRGRGELR